MTWGRPQTLKARARHSLVWVRHGEGQQTYPLLVLTTGQICFEAYEFTQLTPAYATRSQSWRVKALKTIGSLYDYWHAISENGRHSGLAGQEIFSGYQRALAAGTIDQEGNDPTNLYWEPWKPYRIRIAISLLNRFREHCRERQYCEGESSSIWVDWVQKCDRQATRHSYSLLSHLGNGGGQNSRTARIGQHNSRSRVVPFPKHLFEKLLIQGCCRSSTKWENGDRAEYDYNITLQIALLLLAGGGLRLSELFHIFVSDVSGSEVRIYDPVFGSVGAPGPGSPRHRGSESRQQYLRHYGLTPRSMLPLGSTLYAGWKGMLLDQGHPDYFAILHWISPEIKAKFYEIHSHYIRNIQPIRLSHPYYLICTNHRNFGQPWTIGAFYQSFGTALRKVGCQPNRAEGLSPHAFRHLYGQTLVDMRIPPAIIQHAMHHRSIWSQQAYTRPSPGKVSRELESAAARFRQENNLLPAYDEAAPTLWRADKTGLFGPWGSLSQEHPSR